ncbi:MAG: transglycosylase domain-containing protein [Rhizomicrobium sp.]
MNDTPERDNSASGGAVGNLQIRRRRGWRGVLFFGGLTFAVLFAIVLLAAVGYIWSVTRDLPSVEALQNYAPPVTTRVYAGDGTLLGEYARERRIFVPIGFVPKRVVEAFTSAEDRNFFNHPGIDPRRHPPRGHQRRLQRFATSTAGRRIDDHATGRKEFFAQ